MKSPNATTVMSDPSPIDPALRRAFPLNRFGGNGHIAKLGSAYSSVARRDLLVADFQVVLAMRSLLMSTR